MNLPRVVGSVNTFVQMAHRLFFGETVKLQLYTNRHWFRPG